MDCRPSVLARDKPSQDDFWGPNKLSPRRLMDLLHRVLFGLMGHQDRWGRWPFEIWRTTRAVRRGGCPLRFGEGPPGPVGTQLRFSPDWSSRRRWLPGWVPWSEVWGICRWFAIWRAREPALWAVSDWIIGGQPVGGLRFEGPHGQPVGGLRFENPSRSASRWT